MFPVEVLKFCPSHFDLKFILCIWLKLRFIFFFSRQITNCFCNTITYSFTLQRALTRHSHMSAFHIRVGLFLDVLLHWSISLSLCQDTLL